MIEQALVFMSAAVLLVPIFQKLGFGSVLGYLIAGAFIGPQGLKLIQDPESILHLSEFGVVFLLFIIGLEIQPRKLWSMRRHLLGLGGLQVLLCSLAFTALGLLFQLPPLVAAITGFALSLSSTAFAIQTLIEKNLFNTHAGRGSFSILLMQDLTAIPALAIIPMLIATNTVSSSSWSGTLLGFGIIAFLGFASRFLIRPIFRYIASTRSRDLFTAMTLFIVLGVAVLMQAVGLSAALGSFIAGVLLADSEYRHELETNIEPFKSLLMGLFFIAVGMSVSLDLISQNPLLVLSLALGYLLVKSAIIYGIGRFLKMEHSDSKLMALNIAQGGEFAFVIFGLMTQLHLGEENLLAYLVAIITLSMALNPLISLADEQLSRILKRKQDEPQYDPIQNETPEVIIAGFGRFGQIFGRILRAQGIAFVAIDHDSSQIELLRKFGNKVYYGDASREDLLKTAGADRAKYFILAIDDVEISVKTAEMVRRHFPHLKIYARARNRGHTFDLMAAGIETIKRETIDSSISFVGELLIDIGFAPKKAKLIIERFRKHDEIMIHEQFKIRSDDQSLISLAQQSTAQLAQVLSIESTQSHIAPTSESQTH